MTDPELEDEARRRIRARRNFAQMLLVFVVISLAMIAVWAFTGAGYFWPMWPIGGLLLATIFSALNLLGLFRNDVRRSEIEAELERMRRGR